MAPNETGEVATFKDEAVEIFKPQHVEVVIRHDGKTIWINVDGQCSFRAAQCGRIQVNDQRKETSKNRNAVKLPKSR